MDNPYAKATADRIMNNILQEPTQEKEQVTTVPEQNPNKVIPIIPTKLKLSDVVLQCLIEQEDPNNLDKLKFLAIVRARLSQLGNYPNKANIENVNHAVFILRKKLGEILTKEKLLEYQKNKPSDNREENMLFPAKDIVTKVLLEIDNPETIIQSELLEKCQQEASKRGLDGSRLHIQTVTNVRSRLREKIGRPLTREKIEEHLTNPDSAKKGPKKYYANIVREEKLESIIKDLKEGKTYYDILKQYDITVWQIQNIVKKYGLRKRPKKTAVQKVEDNYKKPVPSVPAERVNTDNLATKLKDTAAFVREKGGIAAVRELLDLLEEIRL